MGQYIDILTEETTFQNESKMFKGETAMVGGIITKIKPLVTKTGKNPGSEMCQFWIELPLAKDFEDEEYEETEVKERDDTIQIVAFPDSFSKLKDKIQVGAPVLAKVEKMDSGLNLKNIFRLDLLKESA
jgi:hypothetical protein